jgi:hypothetical protein
MKQEDIRHEMEQALSKARAALEYNWKNPGKHRPLARLGMGFEDKPFQWMDKSLEGLEIDQAMNNARAKQAIFDELKRMAVEHNASAVVTVTDAWVGDPTEKSMKSKSGEIESMLAMGANVAEMERRGYVTRREAIVVTGQTAEFALTFRHYYIRSTGAIHWEERAESLIPQEHYMGRTKMFEPEKADA